MLEAISESESDVFDYVDRLWREAGCPSSRQLAQTAFVSHTTVNDTLRRHRFPAWTSLKAIIDALDGDPHLVQRVMGDEYLGQGRVPQRQASTLIEILEELREIKKILEAL